MEIFVAGKAIGLPDQFLSMPPELTEKPDENDFKDEHEYNHASTMPKVFGGGAIQVNVSKISPKRQPFSALVESIKIPTNRQTTKISLLGFR